MIANYVTAHAPNTNQTHSKNVCTFIPGQTDSYESRIVVPQEDVIEHDGYRIYFGNAEAQKITMPAISTAQWTRHDEKRLGVLVEKYAIGTLTEEEAAEEQRLQNKRRMASEVPARSYDEMLRDARRKITLQSLLEATENYVRAHAQ